MRWLRQLRHLPHKSSSLSLIFKTRVRAVNLISTHAVRGMDRDGHTPIHEHNKTNHSGLATKYLIGRTADRPSEKQGLTSSLCWRPVSGCFPSKLHHVFVHLTQSTTDTVWTCFRASTLWGCNAFCAAKHLAKLYMAVAPSLRNFAL